MPRRIVAAVLLAFVLLPSSATAALMNLRLGDVPPAFTLPDLAGAPVRSDSLAGAPAVVLFWSTWSPRSFEMLEDFTRHAETYGAKGLKLIAVNIDGENLGPAQQEAIRAHAAKLALPFPVVLDGGLRTFAAWGIMAHPTQVVLDAGGRIVYVLPGYPPSLREELEEEIRTLLGIPPARQREALPSVGYVPQGMALSHFNLGRKLLAKGDVDKALDAFRRATSADPAFLEGSIMLARVALSTGGTAEAEQLARQVTPEMINRGDLRYLLGNLVFAKGDLAGAEAAFRALRERLPNEGWGEWGLAQIALARGDRAGALALFRDARALQADNIEGEAYVRRHFRERWLRRETSPEDDGYAALFPSLAELRERYRSLFGAAAAPAPAP